MSWAWQEVNHSVDSSTFDWQGKHSNSVHETVEIPSIHPFRIENQVPTRDGRNFFNFVLRSLLSPVTTDRSSSRHSFSFSIFTSFILFVFAKTSKKTSQIISNLFRVYKIKYDLQFSLLSYQFTIKTIKREKIQEDTKEETTYF